MKYQEAYDKVIQAYFKDEIKPFKPSFCFCGTLANNTCEWGIGDNENLDYNYNEFKKMEYPLMEAVCLGVLGRSWYSEKRVTTREVDSLSLHPNYENAIFKGMCAALEVLKEIHRSRGENVDSPELTKRVLVKV